jgi:hypothetical protein
VCHLFLEDVMKVTSMPVQAFFQSSMHMSHDMVCFHGSPCINVCNARSAEEAFATMSPQNNITHGLIERDIRHVEY